jgi:predicted Zn-dependent protease with MMP-like domain
MAWQHAHRRERINEAVRDAYAQITVDDGDAPDDIVIRVTQALGDDPTRAWDDVVIELATTTDR